MQKQNAATKKPAPAKAEKTPFLTGAPYDSHVPKAALALFGAQFAMAFVFIMLGAVLSFDNVPLRLITNGLVLLAMVLVFYSSGVSGGTVAVNQGEIMYRRQQTDRDISAEELKRCYHPLKGFVIGILGCLPLLLCALILAVIARRQMYSPGALPSWVTGLVRADEVTAPLTVYTRQAGLGLEAVLRIIVRMSLMPIVNMVGGESADAMLLLERLSPLLVLLPGLSYGVGYTRGVQERQRVHSDIAENKKKAAKKARRQKARKARAEQKPQQLN